MSATSLLIKPLEELRLGRPLPVEAQLLDDQGMGIPNATIHYGQGGTGITGPDGVAKLVLPALEGMDLSGNPDDFQVWWRRIEPSRGLLRGGSSLV